MWANLSCHRMLSRIRESGAYAGEFQRSLQECLAHALPFLVPPYVSPVVLVEHDHRKVGIATREYCITDGVDANDLIVTYLLII